MKYNTIIIGGGLAGLTAGATLAKSGKKVLLLRANTTSQVAVPPPLSGVISL
jgi:phytoene dehydrogenase-like protein